MTDPRVLARALEEFGLAKPDDAEARRQQLAQILSDQAVSQGWGWEDPAVFARAEQEDAEPFPRQKATRTVPGEFLEVVAQDRDMGHLDALADRGAFRLDPAQMTRPSNNLYIRGEQSPFITGGAQARRNIRRDIDLRYLALFDRSPAERDYAWGKLSPEEKLEAAPSWIDLTIGEVALPDPLAGLAPPPATMFAMPPYGKGRIR